MLLYSLLVILAVACTTIKEDRSVCPCWCSIDFSNVDPSIDSLYLWFFDESGSLIIRDTIYSGEYHDYYEVELARGVVDYYVWGNVASNTILDDNGTVSSSLLKMDDIQADPLYYYSKRIDTFRENCKDTVNMNKEHSVIDIVLAGGDVHEYPLTMKIEAETAGQYIDGRLIDRKSNIILTPEPGEMNLCLFKFKTMRQSNPGTLKMTLLAVVNDKEVVVGNIPLGMWLAELGYDMSGANLSDISLELDIALGIVTIDIEDWNMTEPVKIVM